MLAQVELYFQPTIISLNLTYLELYDPQYQPDHSQDMYYHCVTKGFPKSIPKNYPREHEICFFVTLNFYPNFRGEGGVESHSTQSVFDFCRQDLVFRTVDFILIPLNIDVHG